MAHEDDLAGGGQAGPYEVHALGDLVDVLVEAADAPAVVGGGEEHVVDGPGGGFECLGELFDVGHCEEAVGEAADEEEGVGFVVRGLGCEFEGG